MKSIADKSTHQPQRKAAITHTSLRKRLGKDIADLPARREDSLFQSNIDNSPTVVAQRVHLDHAYGDAIQRQIPEEEEEELLQGKFPLLQRQGILEEDEEELALLQRQPIPEEDEEELLQGKFATFQRQPIPEEDEEELLQGKFPPLQRQGNLEDDEEELLQGKFSPLQRQGILEEDEEELLQGKSATLQRQPFPEEDEEEPLQGKFFQRADASLQVKTSSVANKTGLPDNLKTGIESLSGIDMSDVRVQRNSSKPARLNALAYTQGEQIHLGPGQERHLPHEAWHAVQQKQGRVRPTGTISGMPLNDNQKLEREADRMGNQAFQMCSEVAISKENKSRTVANSVTSPIQRLVGFEIEMDVPTWEKSSQIDIRPENCGEGRYKADDKLDGFLKGGLGYGTDLKPKQDGYEITTDHSSDISTPHKWIRGRMGNVELPWGLDGTNKAIDLPDMEDRMTNLEYATDAYDELEQGADTRFKTLFDNIEDHAKNTYDLAESNKEERIPDTEEGYYTGTPVDSFKNYLGDHYRGRLKRGIENYKNRFSNKVYLQATVGIIPSAIKELHQTMMPRSLAIEKTYEEHGYKYDYTSIEAAMMDIVTKKIDEIMISRFFRRNRIGKLLLKDEHEVHKDAFEGLLYVIFQYILSDVIFQTSALGGQVKNAVPFLVKMEHMGQLLWKAGPDFLIDLAEIAEKEEEDVAVDQQANRAAYLELVDWVSDELADNEYIEEEFWTKYVRIRGRKIKSRERDKELVGEEKYWKFVENALLGNEANIEGPGEQSKFSEGDVFPIPKIAETTDDQRGVQFEYRYISEYPEIKKKVDERNDTTVLSKTLMDIVHDVQEWNTKYIDDDDKRDILKQARE